MSEDLVTRRLRNQLREFLVGWKLRVIEIEFGNAGISPDTTHQPDVSGDRRRFVEQHYRTLDFRKPADARRFLVAYGAFIDRADRELALTPSPEARTAIDELKLFLRKDGLEYEAGVVVARSTQAKKIFDEAQTLTEVTRVAVFDELRIGSVRWSGRLSEVDFLNRMFDLDTLPSSDGRYSTMAEDVRKHRELNDDWEPDWVFSDTRLALLRGPDATFLEFLCHMVHPTVRPDTAEAARLVASLNVHLAPDGWELASTKSISGRPTYQSRPRGRDLVALPDRQLPDDVLSLEYVRDLATQCEERHASGNYEGAVTLSRTLLEAILTELDRRLSDSPGDDKGELPKQYKRVAKLLRMDDERPELDDRFKDVVRGLVTMVNGFSSLSSKIGDRHARVRKPRAHHSRLMVNAARTAATFLVESYVVQVEAGLLAGRESALKGASNL